MRFLRILRGGFATAIVWAGTWTLGAVAFRCALTLSGTGSRVADLPPLGYVALYGAISGLLFAMLVVSTRHRQLTDFSVRHIAVLGATAAIILPLGWVLGSLALHPDFFSEASPIPMLVAFATAGALTAVGSFVLARKPTGTPPGASGGFFAAPSPVFHADRRTNLENEVTRPHQALLQPTAKCPVLPL